jgi:hypothetical protein
MRRVTVHFSLQPLRSLQAPKGAGQQLDHVRDREQAPPALRSTGATTARAVRLLWESTFDGQRGNDQRDVLERNHDECDDIERDG